ncbi:MAG: FHA domain-containing protein [Lachnospiraceae bacterium]|nr:FHA domain-containing protein [Lachnospiraceae bacterium]
MIVSEYVNGLKNNYVRIRELSLPDERKYQYCIMKRGGISGFLPFEIRYIDSDAYMYYDITSKQNISTIYSQKPLTGKWVKAFFSSMKRIRNEAVRFLLNPGNLIWNPTNVYQDLKDDSFWYLYVPYLDEDNGMSELMDFLVSHIDFTDDELVKCIYSMAEQYKTGGEAYLQEKIFLDAEALTIAPECEESDMPYDSGVKVAESDPDVDDDVNRSPGKDLDDIYDQAEKIGEVFATPGEKKPKLKPRLKRSSKTFEKKTFWGKIRQKDGRMREEYDYGGGWEVIGAVADEIKYSDQGEGDTSEGTVFVDLSSEEKTGKLKSETGQILYELSSESCVIGKKEDADLIIDETGISRMHARIFIKDDEYYLEDLNSTNGTFKNGLKLKPYEKKKLSKGDEIRLATKKMIFS